MLILDIFAIRARTNEGKLQVELAQLKYLMPRLSGKGREMSRLGGGVGTRGPGETKLETDKRHIRRRIEALKDELEHMTSRREQLRSRRKKDGIITVAIVGYTNAGKSTLMNTLTQAGVLSENKLFATLDPTSRALRLPSGISVMMIDTVGLVRRLPHHLVEAFKSTLEEAVPLALNSVIGAYAIVIVDKTQPDRMIAARKGSPLIIGVGDDEFLIGSDATPIIEYTDRVVYLGEEQIAFIERGKDLKITDLRSVEQTAVIKKLELNLSQIEKGGFAHFMLKEIHEQPDTARTVMNGRLHPELGIVKLSGVIDHKDRLLKARRIIICACGTSWHAALIGKYMIEELTRIPVEVEYSSEFRYRNPVIYPDDVVIAISQSGETADTLAAMQLAKASGAFLFGICNVVGSSIARAADTGCYTHAGPEIGVASTKAFTAQVETLLLLALNIAQEKGTVSDELRKRIIAELPRIPAKIEKILKHDKQISELAKTFTYAHNFIYLGRGYNYPIALEGALKLKEISYIHAEGYPAAEMKHGPIALIDEEMPVVVIAPKRGHYDKILSNIQEVKARKGRVISIVTEGDKDVKGISDYSFEIPDTEECLVPLLSVIPLQLLAYHIAIAKGRDVDQPRNLAKSVTVE